MADWDFFKEKLYDKIYIDLNKIWPNVFPLSTESKSEFYEIHEDLIKELFDYMDPNYKKFIIKLLLKLQEEYNLPFASENIIRERLDLNVKNLNKTSENNIKDVSTVNNNLVADKKKQLEIKKQSEWSLINNSELENQKILNQQKLEKTKTENKKIEETIKNQIASKQEEKILEKQKDLIYDKVNYQKIEKQLTFEKESKNNKKKIMLSTSKNLASELEELRRKRIQENKIQKQIDRELLKQEEREFLKYHGKSTKEIKDKLRASKINKLEKFEVNPEEENYIKYYQTVYEPFRVTKNDYYNFIQDKEKKKKIEKDEELQYLQKYTSLLNSQEISRAQNQLKLVSKQDFEEKDIGNIAKISKSINKETINFIKHQITEKENKIKHEREREMSQEKILAFQVQKEIEEERKAKKEEEVKRKKNYAKDLLVQVKEKQEFVNTLEGMSEEEKLYNMELLAKAKKTLSKKFLKNMK
jgi:hypothetical protein